MRLVIRADATTEIGGGHVMRTLALAQEWIAQGGEATFLGNVKSRFLQQRIRSSGANLEQVAPLPPREDVARVVRSLRYCDGPAWCALDGYHFDAAYQEQLQEGGARVLVLDDHRDQQRFFAHVLVNQNLGAEKLSYDAPGAVLLLGSRYGLLRDEFLALGRGEPRKGAVQRILVTLGAGDPENVTETVLEGIACGNLAQVEVRAVVGPLNPNRRRLERLTEARALRARLVQGSRMAELIRWCDFAVSAAGSTCWELCYAAVPFVTVVIAENQRHIGEELERVGAARNLGGHRELNVRRVADVVTEVARDMPLRLEMAARASRLIDGRGRRRVVKVVRGLKTPLPSGGTKE